MVVLVLCSTLEMVNKLYRNRKIKERILRELYETAKRFGMSRTQIYNIINENKENPLIIIFYCLACLYYL